VHTIPWYHGLSFCASATAMLHAACSTTTCQVSSAQATSESTEGRPSSDLRFARMLRLAVAVDVGSQRARGETVLHGANSRKATPNRPATINPISHTTVACSRLLRFPNVYSKCVATWHHCRRLSVCPKTQIMGAMPRSRPA
jgi:hypothetical protein